MLTPAIVKAAGFNMVRAQQVSFPYKTKAKFGQVVYFAFPGPTSTTASSTFASAASDDFHIVRGRPYMGTSC
jgi:hypothetical protein